jgi:hypothetical protein
MQSDKKIRLTVKPLSAPSAPSSISSPAPAISTSKQQPLQHNAPSDHAHGQLKQSTSGPEETTTNHSLNGSTRQFDRFPDGELKWYLGMPMDVVNRDAIFHSPHYLEYIGTNANAQNSAPAQCPMSGLTDGQSDIKDAFEGNLRCLPETDHVYLRTSYYCSIVEIMVKSGYNFSKLFVKSLSQMYLVKYTRLEHE